MSLRLVCNAYSYPASRTPAIRDTTIDVGHGEVVGITGPDDSGKSTICRLVAGLAPRVTGGALDGALEVDGSPASAISTADLSNVVGYVAQHPRTQLSGMSRNVVEEVGFAAYNAGLSRDEVERRARDAIALVGIERLAERDPSRLSGGETQLVVIAASMAMRPVHLVLDEPSSELDPDATQLLVAALQRIVEVGTALLLAEQRPEVLDALCDRLLVLKDGSIVASGARPDVFELPGPAGVDIALPARRRLSEMSGARATALDANRIAELLAEGWPA